MKAKMIQWTMMIILGVEIAMLCLLMYCNMSGPLDIVWK